MADLPEPDPNDYADTLQAQLIVDYVSSGKTIAETCRILGIKRRQDVYESMEGSPRFRELMERARSAGADAIAEECLVIADETTFDDLGGKPNKEWIARSKLRVETRLKLLSKWHPHKYGEKLQVEQKTATVQIPVSDDPIAAQRAYEDLMKL